MDLPATSDAIPGTLVLRDSSGAVTGIAPAIHTHAISDVTNLQTELDGKSSSTHVHGNITNAGAIGSSANLPVITTTSGVLTTGSFGTAANTFCQGNDSRLSDSRAPTTHTHTTASLTDYATGSFTPTVSGGYTSPTYTTQHGSYIRIGALAWFSFRLWAGGTANGNHFTISGLPFTSKNNGNQWPVCTGYINSSATGGGLELKGIIAPNTQRLGLYTQGATGLTLVLGTTIGNSIDILLTGFYEIN